MDRPPVSVPPQQPNYAQLYWDRTAQAVKIIDELGAVAVIAANPGASLPITYAPTTLIFGSATESVTTVTIGDGLASIATPAARTLNFTSALGVDNAAGGLTIIAPLSTGAATPAKIILSVGVPGASGAAIQGAVPGLSIDGATGTPIVTVSELAVVGVTNLGQLTIFFGLKTASNQQAVIGTSDVQSMQLAIGNSTTVSMQLQAINQGIGFAQLDLNPAGGNVKCGGPFILPGGQLLSTTAALTNNGAAQTATLTNGPTAGNPTKWIPINDAGTIRNIPAW